MKKALLISLLISFNVFAMQGVQIENIQHKGNLTAFVIYERGNNGAYGYIVANCEKNVFGYGDLSGEAIDRPETIYFEDFKTGTPNEQYALSMACETDI